MIRGLVSTVLIVATTVAAHAGSPMEAPDLMPVKMRPAPKHAPVELVRDGKPVGVVYLAAGRTPTLDLLLGEVAETIKLRTGAALPVVTNLPAADQPAIVIGDCEETRKAGIDAAKLPIEGFEVRTAPNRVYLVGSTAPVPSNKGVDCPVRNDGTAWAVSDFLERFVGVRWYWPVSVSGRTVEKASDLVVPPVHYADAPAFRKRVHFPPQEYPGTDLRMLLAGLRGGNSWPYQIKVHQPQWWPDGEWQALNKKYPTLFALNADGTRSKGALCYSSKETLAYLLDGCEKAWDQGKYVPWVTEMCLSISPGDAMIDCRCDTCKKLYEPNAPQYGATRGEASRIMALFVKQACEEVKKRWPDKKVMYLPYWNYALCPAGIEFPDNLEIEFCTTGAGGLREAYAREGLDRNIALWSTKTGGPITTWEYSCWIVTWTRAPLQYPHVMQSYYRANRQHLAGSFINGGHAVEWSKNAPSLYVWMRLLWNPEIDVDATLDEMCRRLFGPGAATSRKLLQLMCDRWEKAPWSERMGCAGHLSNTIFNETWPPAVVTEMEKLYRQARDEMKNDPVALKRFDYWNGNFEAFLKEAQESQRIYAVPSLEGVTIDGKADDWRDAGLRVDDLKSAAGAAAKTAGFEPSFRLAWDGKGLLVLAKVLAADFKEADKDDALDTGDGFELFLTPKVGESDPPKNPFPDLLDVIIAPGMDPQHPELRLKVNDMRQTAALKAVAPKVEVARTRIDGGYLLEARLPWDAVGVAAKPGAGAGFQFNATRRQGDGKLFRAVWFPGESKFMWQGKIEAAAYSLYPLKLAP